MSNLPLILTAIRFFGALCFPYIMIWLQGSCIVGFSYSLLALTDWLDGITARRYGESALGKLLDPLADKFLVAGPLILLAVWGTVAWYILGVVIFRELLVATLREYVVERGMSLPVQRIGKLKTVVQMSYISLILFFPNISEIGYLFLDSALLATTGASAFWYSLCVYRKLRA